MEQESRLHGDLDREAVVRELRDVEDELTRLRALNAPRSTGPEDTADAASDLTNQAEQEALVENLEARHEVLSEKLRGLPAQ
jgi:hypothetical protein